MTDPNKLVKILMLYARFEGLAYFRQRWRQTLLHFGLLKEIKKGERDVRISKLVPDKRQKAEVSNELARVDAHA